MIMTVIHENLKAVQDKIQVASGFAAAGLVGMDMGDGDGGITLVAVSKRQPDDRIDAALDAGHRCFGENRVQEAQMRWNARRGSYPDLTLHLIGALQTNKAADAVALFDVI